MNNREDLIQTIYRMTDEGHAANLAFLYICLVYVMSPSIVRIYRTAR